MLVIQLIYFERKSAIASSPYDAELSEGTRKTLSLKNIIAKNLQSGRSERNTEHMINHSVCDTI